MTMASSRRFFVFVVVLFLSGVEENLGRPQISLEYKPMRPTYAHQGSLIGTIVPPGQPWPASPAGYANFSQVNRPPGGGVVQQVIITGNPANTPPSPTVVNRIEEDSTSESSTLPPASLRPPTTISRTTISTEAPQEEARPTTTLDPVILAPVNSTEAVFNVDNNSVVEEITTVVSNVVEDATSAAETNSDNKANSEGTLDSTKGVSSSTETPKETTVAAAAAVNAATTTIAASTTTTTTTTESLTHGPLFTSPVHYTAKPNQETVTKPRPTVESDLMIDSTVLEPDSTLKPVFEPTYTTKPEPEPIPQPKPEPEPRPQPGPYLIPQPEPEPTPGHRPQSGYRPRPEPENEPRPKPSIILLPPKEIPPVSQLLPLVPGGQNYGFPMSPDQEGDTSFELEITQYYEYPSMYPNPFHFNYHNYPGHQPLNYHSFNPFNVVPSQSRYKYQHHHGPQFF